MLSRLIPKHHAHFRLLTSIHHKSQSTTHPTHTHIIPSIFRSLSTNGNNRDQSTSNTWNLSQTDDKYDPFFTDDASKLPGIAGADSPAENSWLDAKDGEYDRDVLKEGGDAGVKNGAVGNEDWPSSEGFQAWNLKEEVKDDVFDIGEISHEVVETKEESSSDVDVEEAKMIEKEKKELTAILKGPNRAFGDLISASGITDAMLDSLIALKDLEGVEGLPPLTEIEDMRYEKNTRKSTRADIERQKQEEDAKARVRQVDDKGRAYGTGRRKCSIARVWVQPGDGKFVINDKEFDVYFPSLDHRAALLRPFSETKTLGLWDVDCTVKGGGTTGQVGAIQLGVSRALQNWEPDLRSPLRAVGFLTRDSRVVERKKPGKAKARKSFQWVKR